LKINKDFEDFFKILNKNKVQYLVVGGYAVIYYSEPIATKDIDIFINPTKKNSEKVYKSIKEFFGVSIKDLSKHDFAKPGIIYQIGISPNRIDILNKIKGISFKKAWKNKKFFKYGKEKVWVIGKEDLIKNKKLLKREQDILHLKKLKVYNLDFKK
jgi:hypothetical protein